MLAAVADIQQLPLCPEQRDADSIGLWRFGRMLGHVFEDLLMRWLSRNWIRGEVFCRRQLRFAQWSFLAICGYFGLQPLERDERIVSWQRRDRDTSGQPVRAVLHAAALGSGNAFVPSGASR